eukprot:CAMPEP_0184673358 /NCGR_PEP_ID=MMETSP0308-20130426/86637_1 /TAXON_ID=38269 /ORGANISM="Gloeochaete witrockiana, Strain SAG 46.84" /LENGTH=303 /DNA_ID=CAMNT_0027120837 /DNA_START=202 /DNA_END=1113 /DNA_ORIENTATION=-
MADTESTKSDKPTSKNTKPMQKDSEECPISECEECGSEMTSRKGGWGRTVWGCSQFPECKFVYKKETQSKKGMEASPKSIDSEQAPISECEDCGSEMASRKGPWGRTVWGCSQFPECKFVYKKETQSKKGMEASPKSIDSEQAPISECEDCGSEMASRKGPWGRMVWGCSQFPECKFVYKKATEPSPKSDPEQAPISECEDCGSEMASRKGPWGRMVWGCSQFPECKFVWKKDSQAATKGSKKENSKDPEASSEQTKRFNQKRPLETSKDTTEGSSEKKSRSEYPRVQHGAEVKSGSSGPRVA